MYQFNHLRLGERKMFERTVSGITLTLLLTGMLTLAFDIQPVKASGTIYIRADGSVDPTTANITNVDNVTYTFADNIYDEIVVERDNIIVDGTSYTLQGTENGVGIDLTGRSNATIKNMEIKAFRRGIYVYDSSNNTISGNNITNNSYGIWLSGSNNTISGNNITNNNYYGIRLYDSSNNTISGNNITNNKEGGIELHGSSNNTISGNNITNIHTGIYLARSSNYNTFSRNNITNNSGGIKLIRSLNNIICHNNFVDNTLYQVFSYESTNVWDDSYPSGGNYWIDHVCTGNPSDGSQPYIIDENNIDHYPFQDPNGWLLHQLTVTSSPITGIQFTINGAPKTTPYTEWLLEGSYTLEMPETYNGYVWSHWLEDGDPNRTKTITLPGTTWTGVFIFAVQPYGPEAEFEAIPDTALTGEPIKFDTSTSLPGWNGTHTMPITEYRWDFADGNQTTTSTPIVYHGFSSPGIYYVTLTVYALGATPETDTISHKVTIISVPVGGYSLLIRVHTTEKPLTFYLALVAILTTVFTIIKRKKHRRTKRP
jgi:parallel beta-helix repeat protein